METPGKGQRQHAYLSVEAERPLLSSLLAESQAGRIAVARRLTKAWEASIGHPVATSTLSRLLHRHHWRQGVPRPQTPRSSKAAQAALKKTFPP